MAKVFGGGRLRRVGPRALAVLGVALVASGAVLGQVRRAFLDSDAFAARLAGSLDDRRVSAFVAEKITHAALREKPDLVAVRPFLLSIAGGVVSSDPFRSVVRVTARQVHAAAMSKGGRNLLLAVPDVGVLLRAALANASPGLAARIPQRLSATIARVGTFGISRFIVDMWQLGRILVWVAGAAVVVGLALLALGIGLAPRRAKALRQASIDLTLTGVILLLLLPVGRALLSAVPATPLAQGAVAGLFDAFVGGLRRLALGLGGAGLVFFAAAQSLLGHARLSGTVQSVGAWLVRPPASTGQRLIRGAFLLGLGVCMVLRTEATLTALAVAAGALLAFLGLEQLFRVVLGAPSEEPVETSGATEGSRTRRAILMLALAGALAGVIALVSRPGSPAIVRVSRGCNGDPRLCARRLDQVVFPGTHNAMASADQPGWMFPAQERGLTAQLDDGVRAFLVDVYAGVPVSGRVKTEISGEPGFLREMESAVGKEGVTAAHRIRERLVGPPEGPRALYLCHGFCELGAAPLVPWLRTLDAFLVEHPRDVVILVLEDYVPPEELAPAFEESGLAELVFRGSPRPPWPTLGEMVDSGQRVVTFLESGSPGVDWMYPAFESIQETPFRFHEPSQFSCRANRGAPPARCSRSTIGLRPLRRRGPPTPPSSTASTSSSGAPCDASGRAPDGRTSSPSTSIERATSSGW